MNFNKDYYKILGVEKNASEDDIKKAFRKLSIEWHPDRHSGESEEKQKEAEEKFKDITEAYEVLKDKDTRAKYDRGEMSDEDMSDIFSRMRSSFFGGGWGGRMQEFHQPGEDVMVNIDVTWEDIKNGGIFNKKINYVANKRCHECHGEGGKTEMCPECHGTGVIVEQKMRGNMAIRSQHPCTRCHGKGKRILDYCKCCHGSGLEKSNESYTVDIPLMALINDSAGLDAGPWGSESPDPAGQNGNLILVINHKLPEGIKIVQDWTATHVVNEIKVPYYDYILGTKYKIETPKGKILKVDIKPGSTKLRVPGAGIEIQGIKGDYYLIVSLDTDSVKNISHKEKKLLEEIKKLHE